MPNDPPLERTADFGELSRAAAVYFTLPPSVRVRRRGRSTAFRLSAGTTRMALRKRGRWWYGDSQADSIACGLTANYGDWKNEFHGYRAFLARV